MFKAIGFRSGWGGVVLAALLAVSLAGCNDAKKRVESTSNLKDLATAAIFYQADHKGNLPDNLEPIKSMIGKPAPGGVIGGGKDFATLIKNPLTGDNPGYEYVKPTAEQEKSISTTVIFYQLRDGKRDTSLPAAYLDGSAH